MVRPETLEARQRLVHPGEVIRHNAADLFDGRRLFLIEPGDDPVTRRLRAMVGERGEPWAKLERLTGVKVRPK